METTALAIREHALTPELARERDRQVVWARDLAVTTASDCKTVEAHMVTAKEIEKRITEYFDRFLIPVLETKRNAEKARKAIVDGRDAELRPLQIAFALAGQKVLIWRQGREHEAEAHLARQLAEARKVAEDEQLAAAQRAKDAGDPALADMILNEEPVITMPAAPLPPEIAPPERTKGLRRPTRAHVEIVDTRICGLWCAQNNLIDAKALLEIVQPLATQQRELCRIPGVRVTMVETMESSGGR